MPQLTRFVRPIFRLLQNAVVSIYDIYEIYDIYNVYDIYDIYGPCRMAVNSIADAALPTDTYKLRSTLKTMNITKRLLQLSPRPALSLTEISRLIEQHRIITPVPSRPSLISLCENGTFETVGGGPTRFGWLVYEDSFLEWVESMSKRPVPRPRRRRNL